MSQAYYVVASRLNSVSKNNEKFNSWEYRINPGISLPEGTQVQVQNAFINKQGVTNNSIEFTEDFTEEFQVGFYVPQTAMYMQKPNRTPVDDRLITADLEDKPGSLGLQMGEIEVPSSNYFDCLVQHNGIHSDGLDLLSIRTDLIAVGSAGSDLTVTIPGDVTSQLKQNMPIQIKNIILRDSSGNKEESGVQAPFCRFYGSVQSTAFDGTNTVVTYDGSASKLGSGNYSSLPLGEGSIYYPNITDEYYQHASGIAYFNSLIGTKIDGETLYEQTRLAQPLNAHDGPSIPDPLEGQIDNMNYEAGIESQLAGEEFRAHTSDPSQSKIWNTSQTSQTSYDFDRGSYSFYFGPTFTQYDSTASDLIAAPVVKRQQCDFANLVHGPNGYNPRLFMNNMTIARTGEGDLRTDWTTTTSSGEVTNRFYPYIDAPTLTEYPDRKDLSVPKPSQPAKFKDTYSPQVDYLRNGYSWDSSPMRCEIFSVGGITMTETIGQENPFQPNIYQARSGQSYSQLDLSTTTTTSFLDRILLSQSMIRGMQPRNDSHPYVERSVTINTQTLSNEQRQQLRMGSVLIGQISLGSQTSAVQDNLFPYRQFRSELDSSATSTRTIYNSEIINVPCMIVTITGEGTSSATITTIKPVSNLPLNGAVIDNFSTYNNIYTPVNETNADVETFASFNPFPLDTFGTDLEIEITAEDWEDQSPQYIPIWSAKGCFSEMGGDSNLESVSSDNDIDLGSGNSCKLNYFHNSMHDQTALDFYKMVGENYAINPNYSYNASDFVGKQLFRVGSHSYYNHEATNSGLREDFAINNRIFVTQRGTDIFGGIHPRRVMQEENSADGLTNFLTNLSQLPRQNYLHSTTRSCSLGGMRPPSDKSFENGSQVVIQTPLDTNGDPQPANFGLTDFSELAENFDPDSETNILKLKVIEERAPRTVIEGISPMLSGTFPTPVSQKDPLGSKNSDHNPNCASALGDADLQSYGIPAIDMTDTGGTNSPLALVQLQAIVENYADNNNDYVLRPLTSDISVTIPKGTYSIEGFLDIFNAQIKNLDQNDPDQLSSIDNMKTVRRFEPLGGLAITGGQVSLMADFLEETHNRTIYSTDPTSEFVKNPLVIAVTTQVYNDLCRAWQASGTAKGVSGWLGAGQTINNAYRNVNGSDILGGTYVWYNFRDNNYWAEFVDKYPDSVENIIDATEQTEEIENDDVQFYFSKYRNLDDTVMTPWDYGSQATLGIGDGGTNPVSVPDQSTVSQYQVDGQIEAQIDKIRKYNSMTKGIYVGAPNFQLTYNSDQSSFSLSQLHWQYRNPTMDLIGETAFPDDIIDQPSILYRTLSELIIGDYEIEGTSYSPAEYIKNALQTPQDHISGVFIFNMSKTVSDSKGDFVNAQSSNVGRSFNDYFSSVEVATDAWEDTLWYRLGFNYDQFNDFLLNKLASYYFEPTSTDDNSENPFSVQTDYFNDTYADTISTTKVRNRQGLASKISDFDKYNFVCNTLQDNFLPGITTKASFDIQALPQIASGPGTTEGQNNTLVRLYNNASITSIRSMSGGYIYYPIRLGTPNSFDGTLNYTVQNISTPGEGYIYQAAQPPITYITSKSGTAVPLADQLAYLRSYEYQSVPVPNFNPTSYYQQTFAQAVSGTDYPVQYEMNNFAPAYHTTFLKPQTSAFNITNGVLRDRTFTLQGSMFKASQTTPILSNPDDILASRLPTLTTQAFFVITSDLIKITDSIKENDQIPVLATVPISSLSSQDFITSFSGFTHTINQEILLNSFTITILNPDLTAPQLSPDSSVILQILIPEGAPPLPLPTQKPFTGKDQEKRELVKEVK